MYTGNERDVSELQWRVGDSAPPSSRAVTAIILIHPRDSMANRVSSHTQLDLFAAPGEAESKAVVAPAPVDAHLTRVGRQLPASIYLGTSTWSFPGWRGLVYAADAPKTKLARHGL